VVSVVVPSMLAVLPYARGRGFDSRSRRVVNSGNDFSFLASVTTIEIGEDI
jgi:hypothetical protein